MDGSISSPWWRKDASVFAALLAFGAIAFTATYFISKSYGRRQDSLARHWLQQGDNDLRANPAKAVADYRTALLYSHDDPAYRLRLAQALAADGHTSQAIAYFLNLLDEQPGNGLYNLELARLYSREGDERKTARYYNAAIYGAWESDPAVARRKARTEYIQFLLRRNSKTQAQAEAIVLAAGVPPNDVAARFQAANLLMNTGVYDRAQEEFSSLLKNDPLPAALGAGQAAFQSGQFQSAEKYLTLALSHNPNNQNAESLLNKANQVLDADPDRRRISSAERARRVSEAYKIAGQRLESCATLKNQQLETTTAVTDLQKLYAEWATTGPTLNARKLADDPDLRDAVMDLVFRIEKITLQQCGLPSGADWALLMLAQHGEGVEH